ncbi:hypothetical protein [Nocardioides convexus]|uniref:hypothetical protein n=1 Tax=Nocardioides convexus TaxID=2712224 RepID=UPI0024189C81|nr:hypothetical protein [Nocardioides convexus]
MTRVRGALAALLLALAATTAGCGLSLEDVPLPKAGGRPDVPGDGGVHRRPQPARGRAGQARRRHGRPGDLRRGGRVRRGGGGSRCPPRCGCGPARGRRSG